MRPNFLPATFFPLLFACANAVHPVPDKDLSAQAQHILDESINQGLNRLGQPGVFDRDSFAHLGLPDDLVRPEKILRRYGLERPLDELRHSIGLAAAAMIGPAKAVLRQKVPECFRPDPALLAGKQDAITRRVRYLCEDPLLAHIRPLASEALRQQRTLVLYRRLVRRLAVVDRSNELPRVDLEEWLARSMLERIFETLAGEERQLRRG